MTRIWMRLEHEQLLEDWRRSSTEEDRGDFVADGPVDFERWEQGPRILFLLRDVDECRNEQVVLQIAQHLQHTLLRLGNCDERAASFVARQAARQRREYGESNRHTLGHWAHWLCPLGSPMDSLKASAIVSMNKWIGGSVTGLCGALLKRDDHWAYVERDANFLCEQIEILEPRLVVVTVPWTRVLRIGLFTAQEAVLRVLSIPTSSTGYALNYGSGLFRDGKRWVLAYCEPASALEGLAEHDMEWVRWLMIRNAPAEERRVLIGHPAWDDLQFNCAECGIEVMSINVDVTRILCDECQQAGCEESPQMECEN
jgi:hypothetical protein